MRYTRPEMFMNATEVTEWLHDTGQMQMTRVSMATFLRALDIAEKLMRYRVLPGAETAHG